VVPLGRANGQDAQADTVPRLWSVVDMETQRMNILEILEILPTHNPSNEHSGDSADAELEPHEWRHRE